MDSNSEVPVGHVNDSCNCNVLSRGGKGLRDDYRVMILVLEQLEDAKHIQTCNLISIGLSVSFALPISPMTTGLSSLQDMLSDF